MKDFIEDLPVISGCIFITAIIITYLSINILFAKKKCFKAIILDKHYKLKTDKTYTGIGNTVNGHVGAIIITEKEPESFLFIVRLKDGKIITAKSTPELYYAKAVNQKVNLCFSLGYLSNTIMNIRAIN